MRLVAAGCQCYQSHSAQLSRLKTAITPNCLHEKLTIVATGHTSGRTICVPANPDPIAYVSTSMDESTLPVTNDI